MRFLLDENFPKTAKSLLEAAGHEVIDLRDTPDQGCEDAEIFRLAQRLEAILLTTDRDFFHTIPHLFTHHAGVLVIALRQPNKHNILKKLTWALSWFGDENFANRVIQLRDVTFLVFPPLSRSPEP